MSKISFSKIVKHTSTVSVIAMLMTVGSVAYAFNGMQQNQPIKSAPSTALQLVSMECQGNWVGAGCVDASAGSSGGQGSTNPEGGKAPEPCPTFSASQSLILLADCGPSPGPAPALHPK